ncbi:MAG: hypothetical protein KJN96_02590 [Eudoraea sp.]|nr:hypothetical protein [Eudoraea sp.]MBT8222038.1 hypothetical protein [Eudoraea sp.]NNJ40037.1 hypothetical protein [Eudoraea sp.]
MKYSKKLNFKYGVLLAVFLGLAIVFESCTCERTAEKTSEKMIEKSLGEDAEVDIDDEKVTIKTEEGTFTADATINSWPDEIPGDVPEFKDGKIMSVSTQEMDDSKNWVVIYEDVSQNALKNYQEELEKAGFKISYTTIVASGGHLAAEKGALAVMLMAGDGNATVTIGTNQ